MNPPRPTRSETLEHTVCVYCRIDVSILLITNTFQKYSFYSANFISSGFLYIFRTAIAT